MSRSSASTSTTRAAARSRREVLGQHHLEKLHERAGHLDARGTAADDDEGQTAGLVDLRIGVGGLELLQDVRADRDGVGDGLQREGVLVHAGHAERARHRARGQHEPVEGNGLTLGGEQLVARPVDSAHGAQSGVHVGPAVEDATHRVGDALGVEAGGGDVVEERLEGVVVALVDDHHVDVAARERTRRAQAAEPCAHDHHAPAGRHLVMLFTRSQANNADNVERA